MTRVQRAQIPVFVLALAGCLPGCNGEASKAKPGDPAASTGSPATSAETSGDPTTPAAPSVSSLTHLERLFHYLPGDPTSVSYDRMSQRLDPDAVEVVFALPPKTGHLLRERELLDEGLDIILDGDAQPSQWLAATSLAFTLPLGDSIYFLRPLTKPASELGPLLEQGFRPSEVIEDLDGHANIQIWQPKHSFPWRIALLDNDVVAFIPIDAVGTGVEPLVEASKLEHSEVETQLTTVLGEDPALELVLVSAQPLMHFDVDQTIAQVQFGLRRLGEGYEGQVVLAPVGDVDDCVAQLRGRTHPEENKQVQGLIAAVEFVPERGGVVGRLAIAPDQVKHFLDL